MKHKCKQLDYCICDISALEPNEECPVHAAGIYPPRCMICGRFMKYKKGNRGKKNDNELAILVLLTSIKECLEIRLRSADQTRNENIAKQLWSYVSGFDGIGTGLLMAIKEIDDRIKEIKRKAVSQY